LTASEQPRPAWWNTILYVLAWIASTALLIVDLLLVRSVIIDLMTSAGLMHQVADPDAWRPRRLTYSWIISTTDLALLLVLLIVGIGGAIAIEHYYRRGVAEGKLRQRVIRVMGIELGFGLIAWLLSALLTWFMVRLAV
jgi:hypothetical protein